MDTKSTNKKNLPACIVIIKYFVFLINLAGLLTGLLLLYYTLNNFLHPVFFNLPSNKSLNVGNLIVSFLSITFSFLGCYGAIRENLLMIKIYIALVILNTSILITLFVIHLTISLDRFKKIFQDDYYSNYNETSVEIKNFFDRYQSKHKCCGINSYKDFINKTIEQLPKSCCNSSKNGTCTKETLYNEGCKIEDLFHLYKAQMNIMLLPTIIINTLLITFVCFLINSINKKRRSI